MHSSAQEFRLPDVGEGLTEAEIVTWRVAVGDTVAVNELIVEIETAKSAVELPTPHSGEVIELLAAEGQTVEVGSPIIRIGAASETTPNTTDAVPGDEDEPKLLVGYGPSESGGRPRRRRAPAPQQPEPASPSHEQEPSPRPRAKPPVRKLAKDLGLDLSAVRPSGPNGIVVRQDVLDYAEPTAPNGTPPVGHAGGETRIPIKGVRKHTAAAMVESAFTAPHVTEFVTIDVTRTLELRAQIQQRREFSDVKLTPLAFVARAYLLSIQRTPMANARWDEQAQEIVVPEAVNLGVAAATSRGLVVPNIKGAQRMSLKELASTINELASTARDGKTPPEAMTHGTTTITNIGVFGIDSGTPILNPGETAILAVGTIRRTPWVVQDDQGERIEPRSVLQLALSFDHRVIDGQQGSELLADTAAVLTEPGLALL